jgi:hypothetical protein
MAQLKPRVVYTPHADATAAGELAALCAVYKLSLESHAKRKGTRPGAPDDGTEKKEDSADAIIPERP